MVRTGRPKLNGAKRSTLQVRVPPEVKVELEKAARLAGISFSSWARERLIAAARKELQNISAKAEIST
jgi:predicted HicB family RNase H-like nuclease